MAIRAEAVGGFFVGAAVILAGVVAYLGYESTPRGQLDAEVTVNYYAAPPAFDSLRRTERTPEWVSDIGRYFLLTLSNRGTEAISDITLRFPGAKYWCLQPEAQARSCRSANSAIVAGNLKPLEKATVQIWSGESFSWNYGDIRITHSKGIAKINLKAAELPESLWASAKTPLAIIGALVFVLVLVVTLIEWIRKEFRNTTGAN